ncbi:MAG: DUF3078 domain-containing protein [Sphingobacteriia bacterium]|nr:DUF3078 domain-containing protein [Sphingobacteriia bacterium]
MYKFTLFTLTFVIAQIWAQIPDLKPVHLDDTIRGWNHSLQAGFNINQSTFSDNWKGGGTNSVALGAVFTDKINYASDKSEYVSDIQLGYGSVQNKGQSIRKTTDRIFIDQKYGYKVHHDFYVFGSLNFQSQFDAGFKYELSKDGIESSALISKFFAPAYFTQSIGLEYKRGQWLSTRAGFGTLRQTFVLDTTLYRNVPSNYGVKAGKKTRFEMAMLLVVDVDRNIMKNLNLKSRYSLFYNYETPKTADSRLDLILTAKVNKYVNVNLSGTVLYDKDMDTSVQYTQALSLGFMYTR